jgi:hypothetical protein
MQRRKPRRTRLIKFFPSSAHKGVAYQR